MAVPRARVQLLGSGRRTFVGYPQPEGQVVADFAFVYGEEHGLQPASVEFWEVTPDQAAMLATAGDHSALEAELTRGDPLPSTKALDANIWLVARGRAREGGNDAGSLAVLQSISNSLAAQSSALERVSETQAAQSSALAAQSSALAAQSSVLERVAEALREPSESASDATPAAYEEAGRNFLRAQLPSRFGLGIIEELSVHRRLGEIQRPAQRENFEWDFRAHVRVLNTNPPARAAAGDFVIFPGHPHYTCPARPTAERKLTPTKVPAAGGAPDSLLSDYVAIFEITTTEDWSAKKKGLLQRLETRLRVSLDRARAETPSIASIQDVCAVVGVVSPQSCADSVSAQVRPGSTKFALLSEMMQVGRFVWLQRPYPASP